MLKLLKALGWVGVVLALFVGLARALFLDAWVIPDARRFEASLAPSLYPGDVVLLYTRGPFAFGDLVRCTDPEDSTQYVVGRIAGQPGNLLEVTGHDLVVSGKRYYAERGCLEPALPVPHPNGSGPVQLECDEVRMGSGTHRRGNYRKANAVTPITVTVKANSLFLVSDDRVFHDDSRDFGQIPIASCTGMVFFRLWGKSSWTDEHHRLTYIH